MIVGNRKRSTRIIRVMSISFLWQKKN